MYGAFYRPDFHKLSLRNTRPSACFKTHSRAFRTHARAFEALRENQKLGREFEMGVEEYRRRWTRGVGVLKIAQFL